MKKILSLVSMFVFTNLIFLMIFTLASAREYAIENGFYTQTVIPLTNPESAADFYSYNTPFAASGDPDFGTVSSAGFIWLYKNSLTGDISLGMIFDRPNDGSGGKVVMSISGIPPSGFVEVEDDPSGMGDNITLTHARWGWDSCCTDGGMFGGLENGSWKITLTLEDCTGIEQWYFLNGPSAASPARVLLDMSQDLVITAMPSPPAVKWRQRPDMDRGVNILSTPEIDPPDFLSVADDWLCLDGSPVTDLHFWGSYLNWMDTRPEPPLVTPGVKAFRIQIYSDAPAQEPGDLSRPDRLLYQVWVEKFNETYVASIPVDWAPGVEFEHKYRYDLDLPRIFWQRPGKTYWLNIAAVPAMPDYPWGWESSMDRWNDFAVRGWYHDPDHYAWEPIPHPWNQEYLDMSFEITTCEHGAKWLQLPDMTNGINIISDVERMVVADDFLCTDGKPVTEVHFWGSFLYCNDTGHWEELNPGPPSAVLPAPPPVEAFKLSFHKDIPAGSDPEMPYSHPGELLMEYMIPIGDFAQSYWDSVPHMDPTGRIWWEHKFYFTTKLREPFEQERGRIYWLDVGALMPSGSNWCWGWETSMDHWNDTAVSGRDERWLNLGAMLVDFEDLPPGAVYHVGDNIAASGFGVSVLPFQWSDGNWTSDGSALVDNTGDAGGSGNELNVNNVNIRFDLSACRPGLLTLLFGEYGGNINLEINGEFHNKPDFQNLNGQYVGGVLVSVTSLGSGKGILKLEGPVADFTVGGQELFIDNIEFACQRDMAFMLITKDRIPYCRSDFDRDGDVDGTDLVRIVADMNRTDCHNTGDCEGDFDYSGAVDAADLEVFAREFGRTDCPCTVPRMEPQ